MQTTRLPPAEVHLHRALKKTAGVFFLLLRLQAPVGETELAYLLELNAETVRHYLRSLQAAGLAERQALRQGWALTTAGRELLAGSFAPAAGASAPEIEPDAEIPRLEALEAENPRLEAAPAEFPRFDSRGAEIPRSTLHTAAVKLNHPASESSAAADLHSQRFKAARQALREAGIFEPTASSLAAMRHVTAEYVRRHALLARAESINSGLLVHRLRCNGPPPPLNRRGHLLDCGCEPCQRDRYRIQADRDG